MWRPPATGSSSNDRVKLFPVTAAMARLLFPLVFLFLAASCSAQGEGPSFRCSGGARKCQALAGYVTDNITTYDAIKTLFGVKSIRALYAANNVSTTTSISARIPAGALVKVPFPCTCANGTGVSDHRPVYTVRSGDTLYHIAAEIFKGFVTYQQIGSVNHVKNLSLIEVNEKFWIPLPCSCDPDNGAEAVHLAHVVAAGSNLTQIATEFGTTEATLSLANNISDPKDLKQGRILDVPIRACNSSIQSSSRDHLLRVPLGSYALTAQSCVKCSCTAASLQLQCEMATGVNATRGLCQPQRCNVTGAAGGLALGESSALGTSCGSTRCEYAGYSGSAIFTTAVTDQSTCGPATGLPGSGAPALRSSPMMQKLPTAPLCVALLLLPWL